MGTDGTKNRWQQSANLIASRINRALSIMTFELGVKDPPKLQAVGSGIFKMVAFGITWKISILPDNES
jgi:hypothetical protein